MRKTLAVVASVALGLLAGCGPGPKVEMPAKPSPPPGAKADLAPLGEGARQRAADAPAGAAGKAR